MPYAAWSSSFWSLRLRSLSSCCPLVKACWVWCSGSVTRVPLESSRTRSCTSPRRSSSFPVLCSHWEPASSTGPSSASFSSHRSASPPQRLRSSSDARWISRRLGRDPRFTAIDAAVGANGFRIVLLLRLSPAFPFNLLNYGLGLTSVRLRDYLLGSFLGMLPGTALYVYIGSLVTSAAELSSGQRPDAGPWGHGLYWGGLGATLLVTVILTRIAKRALTAELANRPTLSPSSEAQR